MAVDAIPNSLRTAFWAAVLVAGGTKSAEAAVLDGIDVFEDISNPALLINVVRSAIRRGAQAAEAIDGVDFLPPELQGVFILPPLSRNCFVLLVLVGLSAEDSAGLLEVSTNEVEKAVCSALNLLPFSCARTPANITVS